MLLIIFGVGILEAYLVTLEAFLHSSKKTLNKHKGRNK